MAKKKDRNQKKASGRKYRNRNTTGLESHKREGSTLVPPFLQFPGPLQPMSWKDDRLPEMLWAVLLVGHAPREAALEIFREVANFIFSLPEEERFADVTHTGLSTLPDHRLKEFLSVIANGPPHRATLRPLLLLKDLPARDAWVEAVEAAPEDQDWDSLAQAVTPCLDHQSQEATDCRWLRVLAGMVAGKLHMPRELGEEILHYPHQGDQRSVRPLIRASEGSLGFTSVKPIPIDLDSRKSMPNEPPEIEKSQWPAQFWEQCFQDTGCWELEMGISEERSEKTTNLARIKEVYAILVRHSLETTRTTAVDAKHDATFGFAFYTLALLEELLRPGNRYSIGGRNTLRTLAECYITFAYLLHVDDETSWMTYRNYGAGQAKLSLLKFEEADDAPPSVDMRVLDQLANEDAWQEFVSIDLGHWQKLNLRKMSEAAGVKEDYDKYYPWPSHYAHGHWGAVRDTVYATCGNPLHRLHRVARDLPRQLPSVLPDACELVDKILDLVDGAYPRFQARVTVVAHS